MQSQIPITFGLKKSPTCDVGQRDFRVEVAEQSDGFGEGGGSHRAPRLGIVHLGTDLEKQQACMPDSKENANQD